jgi:sulfoxide reductase heme-binding subunit YedZ
LDREIPEGAAGVDREGAARANRPLPQTSASSRGASAFVGRLFKPVVFAVCMTPAVVLLYRTFYTGNLGANPAETLLHETGRPALQMLLATIAVSPLRRLTGWSRLIRVRRMLGLFAFSYALVHFSFYLTFDRLFDLAGVVDDVIERKFILSGMTALACMLPLALTSTRGWIRRLGGKRWQRLHRLVYVAAAAGALHFIWKEKVLTAETLTYFSIVTFLLGFRVVDALRRRVGVERLPERETSL